MRKVLVQALVVTLLLTGTVVPTYGQQSPVGLGMLVQLEEMLYGKEQEGAFLPRLEAIETDIYGEPQQGSAFLVRLQRIHNILIGPDSGLSVPMRLNAVEWAMFQQINEGPTISKRLDELEMAMYGHTQADVGLMERLDNLLQLMWPGGKIYDEKVEVKAGTLVRIELMTELSSEKSRVNDKVLYRVVDDVVQGQNVIIPAGAIGEGRIISVSKSGPLGQDGLVEVNFGTTRGIDGTSVSLRMDETAIEKNRSVELAAGASIAGVILLGGPIGLAAGYFVRGKSHVVPAGTQFYVEVSRNTNLTALSLAPSGR